MTHLDRITICSGMKDERLVPSRDLQQIPHETLPGDSRPPTDFTKRPDDVPSGDLRGQPPSPARPACWGHTPTHGGHGRARGLHDVAHPDLTGEGDEVLHVVEGRSAGNLAAAATEERADGSGGQDRDRRPFFQISTIPRKAETCTSPGSTSQLRTRSAHRPPHVDPLRVTPSR